MIYLTGSKQPAVLDYARRTGNLGLLNTPASRYDVTPWPYWAADNGAFNAKTYVGDERWFAWLTAQRRHAKTCLFATAPDVVGDAVQTLARSAPWLPEIRRLGFAAALVAQDGLEDLQVPWEDFDVLFVGGSTDWKLGPAAAELCRQAKQRGKFVHVGRVNSYRRLRHASLQMHADTADGTYLAFGPTTNLPKLSAWFTQLDRQRHEAYYGLVGGVRRA